MLDTGNINTQRCASVAAKYKAREVKKLLDNCKEGFPTLRSLEMEFGLSKNHLQKGFRELYGTTIFNYARSLRLRQVKEMLKDYTLTLDTIALNTGYNGGEALCRFFKSVEGVSPGQWRRDYLNSLP